MRRAKDRKENEPFGEGEDSIPAIIHSFACWSVHLFCKHILNYRSCMRNINVYKKGSLPLKNSGASEGDKLSYYNVASYR